MVKVVVAPNAFKGTLSATDAATAIAKGVKRAWPQAVVRQVPLSDGGDGFVDTLAAGAGGDVEWYRVPGCLGELHDAPILWLEKGQVAAIELATVDGIARLVTPSPGSAGAASSRGVGCLLTAALLRKPARILIGLGGSASTDGGSGLARALGFRFLDAAGVDLPEGGAELRRLVHIVPPRHSVDRGETEIVGAYDVFSPLLGAAGAASVYGPQKGADPSTVTRLDEGLARLVHVVEHELGMNDMHSVAGAGAAGGCGFGLLVFAGARLTRGVTIVADTCQLDQALQGANLVLTGEGHFDHQSLLGKVPGEVVRRAHRFGARCYVLAGSADSGAKRELVRLGAQLLVLQDGADFEIPSSRDSWFGLELAAFGLCSEMSEPAC